MQTGRDASWGGIAADLRYLGVVAPEAIYDEIVCPPRPQWHSDSIAVSDNT